MHPHGSQKLRYSRPRNRRDWKFFVRVLIIPILALAGISALLYQELSFRHRKQTSWTTVTATVEDTRIRPIARFGLEYGSKDLYEVDVLVFYSLNGAPQKEWVPFTEAARPLSEAKAEAASLKGKSCVLRWSPTSPEQKIAELR